MVDTAEGKLQHTLRRIQAEADRAETEQVVSVGRKLSPHVVGIGSQTVPFGQHENYLRTKNRTLRG